MYSVESFIFNWFTNFSLKKIRVLKPISCMANSYSIISKGVKRGDSISPASKTSSFEASKGW